MNTKFKKRLSLIACTAIVFIMLISVLFIVKESNHDCIGQECPICACIQRAEQSLKQLGNGLPAAAVTPVLLSVLLPLYFTVSYFLISANTPVSNKVKMNN